MVMPQHGTQFETGKSNICILGKICVHSLSFRVPPVTTAYFCFCFCVYTVSYVKMYMKDI